MRSCVLVSLALTGCFTASTTPEVTPPAGNGLTPTGTSTTYDGASTGGVGPLRWSAAPDADVQPPLRDVPGERMWLPVYGAPTEGAELIDHNDARWVADTLGGSLLRFEPPKLAPTVIPLGAEPTRVLGIGDAIFVTLRASGEVVRVLATDTPQVIDRVAVGAEPFDLAASADGKILYVALSQEDAVVALASETLEEIGRWRVSGEPKWLTIDRFDQVIVATARSPRVRVIDPWRGDLRTVPLPPLERTPDCEATTTRPLHARITGDPTLSGRNGTLLVPTLYVDTQLFEVPGLGMPTPMPAVDTGDELFTDTSVHVDSDGSPPRPRHCDDEAASRGPYGKPVDPRSPALIGRFNPMLVELDLAGGSRALALGSRLDNRAVRSYPSSVTEVAIDGATSVFVALPGDRAIVQVTLSPFLPSAGVIEPSRTAFGAASGTRTLAASTDKIALFAWSFLARAYVGVGAQEAGVAPALSGVDLDALQLFYDAANPAMSANGSGVSCETCHSDGRNDGLTWQFEDMSRQTPSLAFNPDETTPLTWLGDVASVEDEIHATTLTRMNGSGLSTDQARALAAMVRQIRSPIRPSYDDGSVARGKAVFERADVGCAGCHAGTTLADGRTVKVLDFEVATNTPSLRGVGSTAPYFHDGSASTLADVLERAADGKMGATAHLTAREKDDLITYLMTL